jgi:hypothetical protein
MGITSRIRMIPRRGRLRCGAKEPGAEASVGCVGAKTRQGVLKSGASRKEAANNAPAG